jgi:hypothetical protein
MNQKTLGTLLVAAIAASAAAFFATRSEPTASAEVKSGDKLFPGLIDRVNDVAKVEVKNKDGAFTVAKEGETWGLVEKGGYPVNLDKVKELVVTVAQMGIVEKKSAKPENHASMDVQDVDVKDSGATQVKLFDASGTEAAAVLIGKARTTKGFGGQYAMFARKVGDPQAYEVTGRIWVDGSATNWLADNRQVFKLEKTRVHSVETRHADGTVLDIHKNVPEDQAFAVANLPEGKELKWNGVADATAGALEFLTFEDVAQSGTVDLAGVTPVETNFTTWDGMVVKVKVFEKGEGDAAKAYMALEASFDESKRFKKTAPVGPPPPEATPTDPAADPVAATPPAEAPAPPTEEFVGKTPDEVRKEVDALNAKFSKWIYTVPGYTAANFKKTVADMLKDETAPENEEASPFDDALPPELQPVPPAEVTPPHDDHEGHDHGSESGGGH